MRLLLLCPSFLIEIFICALQAYIFTILATMYLAVAVNHSLAHDSDHLTKEEVPETMGQLTGGERMISKVNKIRSISK